MSAMLFAKLRMLDCSDIPEIDCHGTRRIEFLPDGRVCVWQCEDFVIEPSAPPRFCVPRVKLILPIENFIRNTIAISKWATDHGLSDAPTAGPRVQYLNLGAKH